MRFSANIGLLWPDRPLLARMEAAAAAGFRAVEMHFPYDVAASEVAAVARRRGLALLGINTHPGRSEQWLDGRIVMPAERGLGALAGREAEFQANVDQSIEYCRVSGATAIHAMAGNVPAPDHAGARSVFVRNLRVAADKAALHRLTVLLEPLNPRDNPGYFYSTLPQAASLIEELGLPNVKLQFDVYHVAIAEGDVLTKLERYMPLIGNVQIAGVPDRAEPDDGEIAYGAVFRQLHRLGYEGWVGCEYSPRAGTDEGLRWMSALNTQP